MLHVARYTKSQLPLLYSVCCPVSVYRREIAVVLLVADDAGESFQNLQRFGSVANIQQLKTEEYSKLCG
jgi:hypothetical protein